MIWIALGCVLLGLLVGGAGLKAAGRFAGRNWRPGAAMLSLAAFVAAAGLGARQQWAPAVILFVVGLLVSMSVRRAPHQTNKTSGAPAGRRGGMSEDEARAILGVGPEASEEEVQAAYLRLIRRAHPDQGGTSGLAAQLNAARDVLLRKP